MTEILLTFKKPHKEENKFPPNSKIGWPDTYKKAQAEKDVDCVACRFHCVFPSHSFRSGIGKLQVCKHSSNRIVTGQFAEGLMENFLSEQKGEGLKFALNVIFWIEK